MNTQPKKGISRIYRISSLSTVALFSVSLLLGTIGAGLANSTLQPQPQLVYAQEAFMEICDDFVDNDGDTLIDTDDFENCPLSTGEGGLATGEEGQELVSPETAMTAQVEICDDFIDNDGDNFVDIEDPEDCSPAIEPEVARNSRTIRAVS